VAYFKLILIWTSLTKKYQ